jgi:hypothetical protein
MRKGLLLVVAMVYMVLHIDKRNDASSLTATHSHHTASCTSKARLVHPKSKL